MSYDGINCVSETTLSSVSTLEYNHQDYGHPYFTRLIFQCIIEASVP